VNTVAESMRRQGLQGRKPKRSKGLTRQDKNAAKFPDLQKRDFSAAAPNRKWCGDITEIPTDEGKLYLASVLDLCGRRLLARPMSEHPDAELASDAIKMAAAVRGGRAVIAGVIFHTGRGSTYTANDFTKLCRKIGVRQSMGRVGSCFDNAASEAFFSTLEHKVLSRHHFATKAQAREVITTWCYEFYNVDAQLSRVAATRRIRKNHGHPTGGRITETSTLSGEAHFNDATASSLSTMPVTAFASRDFPRLATKTRAPSGCPTTTYRPAPSTTAPAIRSKRS
jgi:transposase InsO family protein